PSARTFASQEVKDAAELAVGISSAGFKFDRGRSRNLLRVGRVQPGAAELEPVDEQPDPVPAQRLRAAAAHDLAELLHRVGAAPPCRRAPPPRPPRPGCGLQTPPAPPPPAAPRPGAPRPPWRCPS